MSCIQSCRNLYDLSHNAPQYVYSEFYVCLCAGFKCDELKKNTTENKPFGLYCVNGVLFSTPLQNCINHQKLKLCQCCFQKHHLNFYSRDEHYCVIKNIVYLFIHLYYKLLSVLNLKHM